MLLFCNTSCKGFLICLQYQKQIKYCIMFQGARQNNNKDLFISFIIREHLVNNFKDLFATIFLLLRTDLFNQHSIGINNQIGSVLIRRVNAGVKADVRCENIFNQQLTIRIRDRCCISYCSRNNFLSEKSLIRSIHIKGFVAFESLGVLGSCDFSLEIAVSKYWRKSLNCTIKSSYTKNLTGRLLI